MSHEQVAARIQATVKFLDQTLLLSLIEIHHDVAAENNIIALREIFRFQIMEVEMDQFLKGLLDGITVANFVEMAKSIAVVHRGHLTFRVHPFLTRSQNGVADVAGQNFNLPRRRD